MLPEWADRVKGSTVAKDVIAPEVAPDVRLLMSLFPVGSRWQFRTYHPAIWPRDWRRKAEQAAWGMRPGDLLAVTGYGASAGFGEALLMVRERDGTSAMLFPSEVTQIGRGENHGSPGSSGARGAAAPTLPLPVAQAAASSALRSHARAIQDWVDDGGRV